MCVCKCYTPPDSSDLSHVHCRVLLFAVLMFSGLKRAIGIEIDDVKTMKGTPFMEQVLNDFRGEQHTSMDCQTPLLSAIGVAQV